MYNGGISVGIVLYTTVFLEPCECTTKHRNMTRISYPTYSLHFELRLEIFDYLVANLDLIPAPSTILKIIVQKSRITSCRNLA